MNTETLSQKLSRTQHLYIFRGFSNPVDCAQDQLQGRTHYADPDTLRYFKARILSARPKHDGLFYLILESCALDPDNERRGYRAVMFDLFGETVYRPNLDGCRRTRAAAEKDFALWSESFDPIAYYRQALDAKAGNLTRQAEALREIFETETA